MTKWPSWGGALTLTEWFRLAISISPRYYQFRHYDGWLVHLYGVTQRSLHEKPASCSKALSMPM